MKRTIQELQYKQNLPLEVKVKMTKQRIREWVKEFGTQGVYVSFSGGKDSTVLLHIVREMYPNVPAVFCDTGLEYPEIREFVRTFDNVVWLKPNMNFKQVITERGYPVISKEKALYIRAVQNPTDKNEVTRRLRMEGIRSDGTKVRKGMIPYKWQFLVKAPFKISEECCDIMKKRPFHAYEKASGRRPFVGTMACESEIRAKVWLMYGCNAFDNKRGAKSAPLSFWTEQDILRYIKDNGVAIASTYGDIVYRDEFGNRYDDVIDKESARLCTTGASRTGCMFCMFGIHLEDNPNRFERMKTTHPKQYDYIMRPREKGGLGYKEVIDWMNEHGNLNIKY